MTVLDNQIFKTLYLLNIKKNGKLGIIAIGTYNLEMFSYFNGRPINEVFTYCLKTGKTLNAFEYYGNVPYSNLGLETLSIKWYEQAPLSKKTLRTFESIAPMIQFRSSLNILPIKCGVSNLVYSNPFIKNNDGATVCVWTPAFEKKVESNDFVMQAEFLRYKKGVDIFALTDQSQRHIPCELKEDLLINLQTGQVTDEYVNIVGDKLIQAKLLFKDNFWHYIDYKECVVYGFKRR